MFFSSVVKYQINCTLFSSSWSKICLDSDLVERNALSICDEEVLTQSMKLLRVQHTIPKKIFKTIFKNVK